MKHLALSQDYLLKCWDTSFCPKTPHSSVGTLRTVPRPLTQVLVHFTLSQDFRSSVGTLHTVPRPSVGTPRTVPRPYTLVLGHFALSQVLTLKCWDFSHCPKTTNSSVGTLHTVPRPSVGTSRTVTRPLTQVKCWDTSHCRKTLRLGVGTLHAVPRLSFKCWDTSRCPKTLRPSVGTLHTVPKLSVATLRTVPGPPTQALGHFALSQDPSSKCWDTSYCPRTSRTSVETLGTVPRPSVGTFRTVPRPLPQMLGHFERSQDLPLKCWDTSHCIKT